MTQQTTADLFDPRAIRANKPRLLVDVARLLAPLLLLSEPVSRKILSGVMEETFGHSDATGAWSMRDAYDALEAAQVLSYCDHRAITLDGSAALARLDRLSSQLAALPTQTYRSENQVARQQFSTPLTLGYLAARATYATRNDVVLEPSAGTGLLAGWLRELGCTIHLNEIDAQRAFMLGAIFNRSVSTHDAEHINDLLDTSMRPDLVLMNPPFSRSESRGEDAHAGARHLRSALLRLAPGGRCVAIMPDWFSLARSGRKGYEAVSAITPPALDVKITGSAYAKHGTGIDTRILIYDKGGDHVTTNAVASTLAEALAAIDSCPRAIATKVTAAALVSRPALPARRPGGAMLARTTSAATLAPRQTIVTDQTARPLAYGVLLSPKAAADPVGIYVPYRVARIEIEGAKPHPTPLVESTAMASIAPPVPTYRPLLPPVAANALSEAQLETVIYAGQAFEHDLSGTFVPNDAGTLLEAHETGKRYRQGYFLGDGTGAGKGRQVAAIILDQWTQGRRKGLWISKSAALLEDARRDWCAIGGVPVDIQPLDAFPFGTDIPMGSGILFTTYATLRSQRHDQASRLQQILRWLGDEHEGMIVFDESHAMANAAGTETKFGTQKGSEQGLTGVRLQNYLPRARVLYVSATGATNIDNLCYTTRLPLWGIGTAFPKRDQFMAEMTEGGIAAMELVARDLKAQGLYTARALSFDGVEYEMLEHELTVDQVAIYDAYADAWEIIHANLEKAMEETGVVDPIEDKALNAQAKSSALSRFESSKQRFFGQLLISMKMPTLIAEIEHELAANHAPVVQLVTTAEAMLSRRLADLSAEERATLDIELSPREYVIDYLLNAFPTRMMRVFTDGDTARSEPMVDPEGRPVHCQAAIAARDALVERLCAMPIIGSALDELLRHFGTRMVAEVTGRTRRLTWNDRGEQQLESRGSRSNLGETSAFMEGSKRILVFSDAGGTGRSYHADKGSASADLRRIHFLLEPGWKAAEAIQGLGRTNRTNQASAPVFRPCTTNCRGERRFISTIARRLDSLGALTRGQRQTGGQNLFNPADNLESDYAREALTQWYHLLASGVLTSVKFDDFCRMTGLKLVEKGSETLLSELPPIQRWLNRILALRISIQDAIFDEYIGLIEKRIDAAREAGTLDVGVESIAAEEVKVLAEHVIRVDPYSGAETKLFSLELHRRRRVTTLRRLSQTYDLDHAGKRLKNGRSGRVAFLSPSYSYPQPDGTMVKTFELIRPGGSQRTTQEQLDESFWGPIGAETFDQSWDAEVSNIGDGLDVETIHLATGLLLPIWNKLPQGSMRVWRVTDNAGRTMLGRIIPARALEELAVGLGVDVDIKIPIGDIVTAARTRAGISPAALEGTKLGTVVVNGQQRIEAKDFPAQRLGHWKSLGCFSEIIAFKTRLFVPVDRATEVITAMMEAAPSRDAIIVADTMWPLIPTRLAGVLDWAVGG